MEMDAYPRLHNEGERPGDDPIHEAPVAIDPHRPPQRNDDNISCRCGCPAARTTTDHTIHHAEDRVDQPHVEDYDDDSDRSSECSEGPVSGDEGLDDHLMGIENGERSYNLTALTHHTFARPHRCTWHIGVLPDEYPFYSPVPSRDESPGDSMIVEPGSGEHSMESSTALSIFSTTSSVFEHTGGGPWLQLTEHPTELSISSSEFCDVCGELGDYDF